VDDASSFDKMDRWGLRYHENEDYDEDATVESQDGCEPYWLEVFGPALTRLTANQAVDMLQVSRGIRNFSIVSAGCLHLSLTENMHGSGGAVEAGRVPTDRPGAVEAGRVPTDRPACSR
jgi:hypothetical protein